MRKFIPILAIALIAACTGNSADATTTVKAPEVSSVYASDFEGNADKPNGIVHTILVEGVKILVRYDGDTIFRVLNYNQIPRGESDFQVYVGSFGRDGSPDMLLTSRWQAVKGGLLLEYPTGAGLSVKFARGDKFSFCNVKAPLVLSSKSSGMVVDCGE